MKKRNAPTFAGMNKVNYSKSLLELNSGHASAVHRFREENSSVPILLIHGSIEDSRIFHSRSGKGFAPFLARNGFDVFAPDLAGKGESLPKIKKGFAHSQEDFIYQDMKTYLSYIRTYYPDTPIRMGAHSWGGVLILAWYALFGDPDSIGPMVFFGSKRQISVISLRRIFTVDAVWTGVGEMATHVKGYLPARDLRMGSENEPAEFYRQVNKWVYSKNWIDPKSGDDISNLLKSKEVPPVLYLAGRNDKVLGHPKDVLKLKNETGSDEAEFVLLSKKNGHQRNYGHIDLLTAPECVHDHFPIAVNWLKAEKAK